MATGKGKIYKLVNLYYVKRQHKYNENEHIRDKTVINWTNKKAVLSLGNRAMPHAAVLFGLKFADDIHYKFAKLRKPSFRAPNIPAQNRI